MNSSPTSDPWIGRLIGDRQRYRLEKRIGAGGMGDVFLAMDTLLGQQVALKLLKDTLVAAEDLRKRFEREAALCAALKSDHIVQVTDYGVITEGYPFYVMEYLRGQSLGQLLRREKRLSVERTVSVISQICAGLQLAHKGVILWRDGATASEHIQVVHRDLKPDNIFLVPTALGELVKILDFGIAKIRDDAAEYTNLTSTFLGTFRYAAPEQLQVEQDLDGRADIYSLGIILYEMLSGSDPFGFGVKARSTTGVSWGMAHAAKQPQPLRTQQDCEQLPAALEAVVMRCLQKSPADRFQSVDELNQALQASISGLSNAATPSPTHSDQIDITIPQTPSTPRQGYDDETIPHSLTPARQNIPEVTSAQIQSAPIQGSSDETIPRSLTFAGQSIAEVTSAQTPSPLRQKVSNGTSSQTTTQLKPHLLSTRLLLPLAAGIVISLAVMGAIYAYFQSQQRDYGDLNKPQQSSTPALPKPTESPTPTVPTDACDDPESLFCDNNN